jgi:valyl-tRNA synthetase
VTGFDIIFFWVARMIMMTTHFIKEVPFKKIFIHGLIKDSEGQKMSKSKGNTLDPLDIIDGINLKELLEKRTQGLMQPQMRERIEKRTIKEFPEGINAYGTDALRLTFCSLASGGRDINFDMKRVEGYRNFCNKLWNASRFIDLQLEKYEISDEESNENIDQWINFKLNETSKKVEGTFENYRFDLITKAIYEFIWYEFCDWYIELSKIRLSNESTDNASKAKIIRSMVNTLEKTLRLAHPIMPFITEEIWQHHRNHYQTPCESIMISSFPTAENSFELENYDSVEWLKAVVTGIRNIRGELSIKPSIKIKCLMKDGNELDQKNIEQFEDLVIEMTGLSELTWLGTGISPPSAIFVQNHLKTLVPLEGLIDPTNEISRVEKAIMKLEKERSMILGKLENKEFLENAPTDLINGQKARHENIVTEVDNLKGQLNEITKLI